MAGAKGKIKGKANEAVGATRKKTGQVTGNEKMEAKGATQEIKGKAQGVIGKAKGKLSR
jgi:uncharacterized protein YjbJ (UPF0337 family)